MSDAATSPSHGRHIPVLDGIRALAILLVMFQHFFHGIEKGSFVGDAVVWGLASRSWMGVDLFFVLSGFLITGILWKAKGRSHYFSHFYARRTLRIFPLYYFALFLFFVVLPMLGSPAIDAYLADSAPDQAWHWAYLSNFRIAWKGVWYQHHIPNVFWSLAIEEQFYLVWPLVVLVCSRRALLATCTVLFGVALSLRLVLALDPHVSWVSSFVLTPARMDGLVLGAFLAILARDPGGLARWRRVALVVGVVACIPIALLELHRPAGWRELPLQSLRFSGIALVFGALLVITVTAKPRTLLARAFGSRPMLFLGKYSYALYMWHGPVSTWMRAIYNPNDAALVGGSRLPAQLLYVALTTTASIAAALLSWNLLERHFLKLKERFR